MQAQGITNACSEVWARGATALIGISPFNSYFDEERIRQLLTACSAGGREVIAFIPDDVTTHTLEARGYPPPKAARKTRRQVQYLRNKIARAADGTPPPILGCVELDALAPYRKRRAELADRFEHDAAFREGCLSTTRWVLAAGPGDTVCESATQHGVQYLLAELPMFLHAPEIVGRDAVAFVYHQCPEFVRDLFSGTHGPVVGDGQAFVEMA
jgi:cyclo(L-tyrosyl-L-tyrosyl) synthase